MSMFITLEGPEGSGKTIQAARLATHLEQTGRNVLLTREPGGTDIGDQIRKILMDLENTAMSPQTEFLLFSAARAQHVHQVIRPFLEQGGVVISDRFFDSSLAYQGFGQELNLKTLRMITAFATGGLTPDLTLLLDLPCEVGLARRREGGSWNRMDDYDLEFHRRARKGYHLLVEQEPERWVIVDADQAMDAVQQEVLEVVEARLSSAK